MTYYRSKVDLLVALIIGLMVQLLSWQAAAETNPKYFVDDFEDLNLVDDTPVSWGIWGEHIGPKSIDASIGDLVVTATSAVYAGVGELSDVAYTYEDVSIRSQVAVASGQRWFYTGLYARANDLGMYDAGITSGDHWLPNAIHIARWSWEDEGRIDSLRSVPTHLDPSQHDVLLQFDVAGDTLTLTAWEAGTPKELGQTISVRDLQFQQGNVGVEYFVTTQPPVANPAPGTYRYYAVAPQARVFDSDFTGDMEFNISDLNAMLAKGPVSPGVPVVLGVNEQFDLTGDGLIDSADVDRWLADAAIINGTASPYKRGDINLDGLVDDTDFNIWNAHKFTSSLAWDDGDVNGDGFVDVSDFNVWNANKYTSSDSGAFVPEPALLPMLIPTFIAWSFRRKKR
ncbi:MAG: hypothetical protein KDA60_09820 [Planctomycetales bacterium]|nr:hypothetical protein [Planctomycetales bacterium]